MRTPSLVIAGALALAFATSAQARPRRAAPQPPAPPMAPVAPVPPLAPLPPAPPLAPALAIAPLAPMPPLDAFAPPPMPPMPPGASFSFSFGKGRLGVHVSSMTGELRRFFGAPEDSGLLVQSVETDTPASKAGVDVGDVIVVVDGDSIQDVGDVAEALSDRNSGDTVDIVVFRGKKRRELRAELRDDANAGWQTGTLPGGGSFHVFGGGGDDELRKELDELRERLQSLESELGKKKKPSGVKPKAKRPKASPKSDPKKT